MILTKSNPVVIVYCLCLLLLLPDPSDGLRMKRQTASSPPPSIFDFLSFRPQITVSKFPPIVEIIAQRIQAQFSNYIYEDLSRPQTYDRPTYKPYVAPLTSTSTETSRQTQKDDELQSISTTTDLPFIIPTVSPPILVIVDAYELIQTTNFNSTIEFEYQLKQLHKHEDNTSSLTMTMELENDVKNILKENYLRENTTHIFEIDNKENAIDEKKYKEVSTLFTLNEDKDNAAITNYLLRHDYSHVNEEKNKCQKCLIALTKIGQHVYVNTIYIKHSHQDEAQKPDHDVGLTKEFTYTEP